MPRSETLDRLAAIGAGISALRRDRGLGVDETALAAGCSRERLEAIEAGRAPLDSVALIGLSEALGVSANVILNGRGTPRHHDDHVAWGIDLLETMASCERLVNRYGL